MAPALRDSCVNTVSQKRRRKQCLIVSLCWPSVPLGFLFLLNLKNAIKKLHTLFSAQCFSVILQWGLFFSVKDWVVSLTTKGNDDKEIIHRTAQLRIGLSIAQYYDAKHELKTLYPLPSTQTRSGFSCPDPWTEACRRGKLQSVGCPGQDTQPDPPGTVDLEGAALSRRQPQYDNPSPNKAASQKGRLMLKINVINCLSTVQNSMFKTIDLKKKITLKFTFWK